MISITLLRRCNALLQSLVQFVEEARHYSCLQINQFVLLMHQSCRRVPRSSLLWACPSSIDIVNVRGSDLHIPSVLAACTRRGKRPDTRLLELASRHVRIEQHIHLRIRAALRLRHAEIGPNGTQGAGSSPEESSLGAPVPCVRVEHVGGEDVGNDASDVVEVAGEDDGLVAQASGRDLGDEGVAGVRSVSEF